VVVVSGAGQTIVPLKLQSGIIQLISPEKSQFGVAQLYISVVEGIQSAPKSNNLTVVVPSGATTS